MSKFFALFAIPWTESERGWGQRPDGWSFHISQKAANDFIKNYQDRLPKDHVPDEYSFPGSIRLVEVSKELYEAVVQDGCRWLFINDINMYKTYVPRKRENTQRELDKEYLSYVSTIVPKDVSDKLKQIAERL